MKGKTRNPGIRLRLMTNCSIGIVLFLHVCQPIGETEVIFTQDEQAD